MVAPGWLPASPLKVETQKSLQPFLKIASFFSNLPPPLYDKMTLTSPFNSGILHTMRKLRDDYNLERNEHIVKLHEDYGLSINEIALNSLHNPDKLSQQRIHQIISEHRRNIEQKRFVKAD